MNKVYQVTENGTVTHISIRDGLAIVNDAMMAGRREVATMSSSYGQHRITYKYGRTLTLILVDDPATVAAQTEPEPRTARIYQRASGDVMGRVVTAKGKDYVVTEIVPADRPIHANAPKGWTPTAYVTYWSVRNGERFGSTRTAGPGSKPGTTGRAIWDAANQ